MNVFWLPLAVGIVLQTTAILLVGLTAGRLGRRRGPAWQSAVYRTTLVAMVGSCAITVTVAGHIAAPLNVTDRIAPSIVTTVQPESHVLEPITAASVGGGASAIGVTSAARANQPLVMPASHSDSSGSRLQRIPTCRSGFARPGNIARRIWCGFAVRLPALLLGVWLLGVATLLLRDAYGALLLARLERSATSLCSDDAHRCVMSIAARLEVVAPAVRCHPSVTTPFLAGLVRETLFLPADYELQYDAATMQAIVSHELAHCARRDCLWLAISRFVGAAFWPQPFIWLLNRNLAQASEEACDSAVLALGCPARQYADSLLALAGRMAGRRDPAYGVGITPVRSSVGRRIMLILDTSRAYVARTPKSVQATIALAAIVAVGFAVMIFCPSAVHNVDTAEAQAGPPMIPPPVWAVPPDYASHFTLARKSGWSLAPVRGIPTAFRPNGYEKTLPQPIPGADLALMIACHEDGEATGQPGAQVLNGGITYGSSGPPDSLRIRIERILDGHPHFFYAEYQLAVWYSEKGRMDLYWQWLSRSLADAPAILAGRLQYEDGSPIVGVSFAPKISYFASDDASNMAGTRIEYEQACTDSDGCYYIPVYKSLYGYDSYSYMGPPVKPSTDDLGSFGMITEANAIESQSAGRFVSDQRVGLLPPKVARPYIAFSGPFADVKTSQAAPLNLWSNKITFAWTPYPNVTHYEISLIEIVQNGKEGASGSSTTFQDVGPDSGWTGSSTKGTSITLDLDGKAPIFNREHTYQLHVTGRRGDEQYADSRDFYFVPEHGLAPVVGAKATSASPHARQPLLGIRRDGSPPGKGVAFASDDPALRSLPFLRSHPYFNSTPLPRALQADPAIVYGPPEVIDQPHDERR